MREGRARQRRAIVRIVAGLLPFAVVCVCLAGVAVAETVPVDSLLVRAQRHLADGEADEAETGFLEVLSISKGEHRAEKGLAIVGLVRGDADYAIEHARKAVKRDKRNSEYHLLLANGYGMKAQQGGLKAMFYGGKYKKECELAVKYDPANVDAHVGLLYYYAYAPSIAGGGEKKVVATIETITSLDPLRGALAEAFWAEQNEDDGTFEAADIEAAYLEATRIDSTNPDGWWGLAWFYLARDRPAEAIPVLERLVSLEPDESLPVYQLAKARLLAGDDLAAAEAGFREFIAAGKESGQVTIASAHWRLGQVFEKAGRPSEARVEWETALSLDAEHEGAREALSRLAEAQLETE